MKKTLLLMAMSLFAFTGVFAQDEEEPSLPPVYTKSFLAVIDDAKSIVASNHYTTGQADLQKAINEAEGKVAGFTTNDEVREALIALQYAIDQFVYGNPHVDATEKIVNPTFNVNSTNNDTNVDGWTNKGFKENARANNYATTRSSEDPEVTYVIAQFVEQWSNASNGSITSSGDINQTIKGLPAGHYRLTADIFVKNQKYDATCEEAVGVELYANDVARQIGMTGVTDQEAAAFSVDFDIAEGQDAVIGFRFSEVNINWLGWDNVTLYYIGDPEAYNSIVNVEKLAAAKEELAASIKAAEDALAVEDMPFARADLQTAIDNAKSYQESTTLEDVQQAKTDLDAQLKSFNDYNKHYTALKQAIEAAEANIAEGKMTNEVEAYQTAIAAAKAELAKAGTEYADIPDAGATAMDDAKAELAKADAAFAVANASYAHPANVITNGAMNSTDGWEILVDGANPGLHINTSGTVTNFSKPFMECWVNNIDYGQANYAKQTISALPDGRELPAGYYVLKAAVLATRQDQAGAQITGVNLKFQDQEQAVSTANGVANIYTIGYDKPEAGGEITVGLFIDETTNANWIAWDEVEIQFVGDKNKYIADKLEAELGDGLQRLQTALDDAQKVVESVDMNGVDFEYTKLYTVMDDSKFVLENPTDELVSEEYINQLIKDLGDAVNEFYTCGVSPKAGEHFDFTSFIVNPDFDQEATTGWTCDEGVLPGATDCVNWWFGSSGPDATTQEFYQTLMGLPAGNYLLDVQAAIRVDMTYATDGYTAENLPSNVTLCKVYANTDSTDVHPFFYEDEAKGLTLQSMLEMTNDYDYRHGNGTLIDYMLKESGYFHNYVKFSLEKEGDVKIGFRVELPKKGGQMPFIDFFHLYYFGNQEATTGDETAIAAVQATQADNAVYNLKGQKVGLSVKGLAKGLYIVGGKKIVVR